MLTEMAGMSVEDGMVMQIHPGAFRNHNRRCLRAAIGARQGRRHPDAGPIMSAALKPLLDRFGNDRG